MQGRGRPGAVYRGCQGASSAQKSPSDFATFSFMLDSTTMSKKQSALASKREHRRIWIARLGGKCVECGTTERLEFDHIDPATKSFRVSEFFCRKVDGLSEEMAKCQLLCKSHHVEKTMRERGLAPSPHGSRNRYKHHGCRCPECKAGECARKRRQRANRPKKPKAPRAPRPPLPPRHGTVYQYVKRKCRCEPCRAAMAVQSRKNYKAMKNRKPPADMKHGYSGYAHWRCRCEVCVAAKVKHNKDYRMRRQARGNES